MSLLFVGDVAHPFSEAPLWPCISKNVPIVLNLEGGLISVKDKRVTTSDSCLFNDSSILDTFEEHNVVAVCLANNHTFDLSNNIRNTIKLLSERGIQAFGAGESDFEASKELLLDNLSTKYVLLGFGWSTIQCKPSTKHSQGVNVLTSRRLVDFAKLIRAKYPDRIIIYSCHWNYELERYPQPAHRQLSHELIDIGVDCIIGHHPHVVNGIEIYKSKPIVYSLGNWWLPQKQFYNGTVSYPELSKLQLAFEFSSDGKHICHWFINDNNKLTKISSAPVKDCVICKSVTPFSNMNHVEYQKWFRRNRVKKKLLPIYNKPFSFFNSFFDKYIKLRHFLVVFIKRLVK